MKNSGWVCSSNAYNYLLALHKLGIFGSILLIMWVGGFENGEKFAYVIKVCPLMGCNPFANYHFQMEVTVMGFAEHFG